MDGEVTEIKGGDATISTSNGKTVRLPAQLYHSISSMLVQIMYIWCSELETIYSI